MRLPALLAVLAGCLPALSAAELLTNGGFDQGIGSWSPQVIPLEGGTALPGSITASKDGTDGVVRLQRTATGGNTFSVQIYQRVAVEPGKRYFCKIKARSANDSWLMVLLMRDEGDYAAATDPVYQGLSAGFSEVVLPLAPRSGVTGPLRLNLSLDDRSADKSVEITSVSLESVE